MTLKSRLVLALGLASLVLAGCASDIPYATLKAKYSTPASQFATLPDGVTVHFRDQGLRSGPPLVLVHGFAANLDTWEPWVQRLGDRYRVITLDLPAHGLTTVPADYQVSTDGQVEVIDQLTQRLGAERFYLAGNSMGGGASWHFALAHPDRVRALILVDSVGFSPKPEAGKSTREGPPLVFRIMANPMGRAVLEKINPRPLAGPGLKKAYVDGALVTPALVDRYVDLALAPGHRALLMGGQRPASPTSPDALKALTMPVLVMHGEADTVIPVEAGKALAGAIPGAKLILYPGVGHVPMEQIPDLSARDLGAFLFAY